MSIPTHYLRTMERCVLLIRIDEAIYSRFGAYDVFLIKTSFARVLWSLRQHRGPRRKRLAWHVKGHVRHSEQEQSALQL